MKSPIKILGLLAAFTVLACSPDTNNTVEGKDPATKMGSSSGGGGFRDESSDYLLNRAVKELSTQIQNSSPGLWVNLPKGWNQTRLAELIKNTKSLPSEARFRHDKELMYDYGVDKKGNPYIAATQQFFKAHSLVNVNVIGDKELNKFAEEIKLRLLHEAFHVLGVGKSEKTDVEARVMANLTQTALKSNIIYCESKGDVPENWFRRNDERLVMSLHASENKYVWEIHRPSGLGLYFDRLRERESFLVPESFDELAFEETAVDFDDLLKLHYEITGDYFGYIKSQLTDGYILKTLPDDEGSPDYINLINHIQNRNLNDESYIHDWDQIKTNKQKISFSHKHPVVDSQGLLEIISADDSNAKGKALNLFENITITFNNKNQIRKAIYKFEQRRGIVDFPIGRVNYDQALDVLRIPKNKSDKIEIGEINLKCREVINKLIKIKEIPQATELYKKFCEISDGINLPPICNLLSKR